MNVVLHWQDDDSSASKCFTDFPDAKIMLCSGHAARAQKAWALGSSLFRVVLGWHRLSFTHVS